MPKRKSKSKGESAVVPIYGRNRPRLDVSSIAHGRYTVEKPLGRGSFGDIFKVVDSSTGEALACKMESKAGKDILREEAKFLRMCSGLPGVVQIVDDGIDKKSNVNWMVMELEGPNIANKRRAMGKFSMATVANLGIRMLRSLEEVHGVGIVHRDVKPGNFVESTDEHNGMKIIDFGNAAKASGRGGLAKKSSARFYGTAKYASINAHERKPLSARDDLISLGYFLVEAAAGQLPWSHLCHGNADKTAIAKLKAKHRGGRVAEELHEGLADFMDHVDVPGKKSMSVRSLDYNLLDAILHDILDDVGADESTPYDWKTRGRGRRSPASFTSSSSYTPGHEARQRQKRGGGRGRSPRGRSSSALLRKRKVASKSARSKRRPARRESMSSSSSSSSSSSPLFSSSSGRARMRQRKGERRRSRSSASSSSSRSRRAGGRGVPISSRERRRLSYANSSTESSTSYGIEDEEYYSYY